VAHRDNEDENAEDSSTVGDDTPTTDNE